MKIRCIRTNQVCVFFWADRKNKMAARPLIGWGIFDYSSETAERNSTKLDRMQDLNVLYQVCVFRADRKNKMAARSLISRDIFDCSSETAEWSSTKLDRMQDLNVLYQRSQRPLPSLCFSGRSEKQDGRPASDWLRQVRLLLWNRWTEFNETWQEARSQRPLQSLCFSGQSEKQDGRPDQFVKKWHIVLRCTICGPLDPLFQFVENGAGSLAIGR